MFYAFLGLAAAVFGVQSAIGIYQATRSYRILLSVAATLFLLAGVYPLGNTSSELPVFLRHTKKIDDLLQFLDRFVDPGHVVKGNFQIFLGVQLAATAAELHRTRSAAEAALPMTHADGGRGQ